MADPATPPAAAAAAGKPDTLTQNGALAFSSAGSACLDLFFRSVRGVATPELDRLLSAAWAESPIDCVRLIFQTRDCRGGKGEKAIFVHSLKWLLQNQYVRAGREPATSLTWPDDRLLACSRQPRDLQEEPGPCAVLWHLEGPLGARRNRGREGRAAALCRAAPSRPRAARAGR